LHHPSIEKYCLPSHARFFLARDLRQRKQNQPPSPIVKKVSIEEVTPVYRSHGKIAEERDFPDNPDLMI
jgi:hypothetical protein